MTIVTGLLGNSRLRHCAGLAATFALLGVGTQRAEAAVPAAALAAGLPTQAGYGTIKGRLVWGGDAAPPAKDLQPKGGAAKDPAVCAASKAIPDDRLVVDPKTKGVRYGFAYLQRPSGQNAEAYKAIAEKNPKVVMDQMNCQFVPHVIAVTQDQAVEFKSSDAVGHNLRYAPFKNAPLNQMIAPNGKLDAKLVAERLPIEVKCDIHPWMTGYMMVFDHPFFTITGDDGSFEIKGVPAGTQKLVVWQERVGYVTEGKAVGQPVQVTAGQVTDVGDIKLDPAKVH